MPIVVRLDVMLARRKMKARELAQRIDLSEVNVSILRSGRARGVRFDTLAAICHALECQPGDILVYEPDPADLPPSGEDDAATGA
jgi:putative transcriptional regulator